MNRATKMPDACHAVEEVFCRQDGKMTEEHIIQMA